MLRAYYTCFSASRFPIYELSSHKKSLLRNFIWPCWRLATGAKLPSAVAVRLRVATVSDVGDVRTTSLLYLKCIARIEFNKPEIAYRISHNFATTKPNETTFLMTNRIQIFRTSRTNNSNWNSSLKVLSSSLSPLLLAHFYVRARHTLIHHCIFVGNRAAFAVVGLLPSLTNWTRTVASQSSITTAVVAAAAEANIELIFYFPSKNGPNFHFRICVTVCVCIAPSLSCRRVSQCAAGRLILNDHFNDSL